MIVSSRMEVRRGCWQEPRSLRPSRVIRVLRLLGYCMAKASSQIKSLSERDAALRRSRDLKMAGSASAYVRGNTLKFYEWLAASDIGKLPQGPPIWICGDCPCR